MDPWPWPDSLDALVAAPRHHKLVLDNDRVRVLDTRIPAGDLVPVHTHRWPAVYYTISGGDFVRYDGEGNVLECGALAKPLGQLVDHQGWGRGGWIFPTGTRHRFDHVRGKPFGGAYPSFWWWPTARPGGSIAGLVSRGAGPRTPHRWATTTRKRQRHKTAPSSVI